MKRIFAFILLAGAMLANVNAQTATEQDRWVWVTRSADGQANVYIDSETIRASGNTVLVWEKIVRSSGYWLYHDQIREDRQSRDLQMARYDTQGNMTYRSDTPTEWLDPMPGSIQEGLNRRFDVFMKLASPKDTPTVRY